MPQANELVRIRRLISSLAQPPTNCSIGERNMLAGVGECLGEHVALGRIGRDRRPARDDVEEPEPDDRYVERQRDDPLRVA